MNDDDKNTNPTGFTDDQLSDSIDDSQSEIVGEASASGTTPAVDSDDNTLDNVHDMDMYKKSDEEHPTELNVAEEIEKAEDEQR